MEEIKMIGTGLAFVVLIVGLIVGLVMGAVFVHESSLDKQLARSIQCKEGGGVMTYESYSWICK